MERPRSRITIFLSGLFLPSFLFTNVNKPAPTFQEKIDIFFGENIVSPLAAILFWPIPGLEMPLVVAWLLAGAIFLTLRLRFVNIRLFRHAIDLTRGKYDKPGETGEVSHFQALSAALSATVGLGNIAGVAIAIGTGGPGACFWIIAIGLLGMSAKFAECTLGQLYRTKDSDGHVLGGPMRYLKTGLTEIGLAPLGNFLAVLFMLLCIGASFGGGNAFQIGQSLEAISGDITILQDFPVIYGLIMAVMVGVVIVGGMRSIGAVASKIVPFMCGAYVLAALFILATNLTEIPAAIGLIVSQAFSPEAAYGGFLGVLVIGVKRAVFSNEAGVGSAAIAHSAAKTEEPVSEGIVALLEPFIDTEPPRVRVLPKTRSATKFGADAFASIKTDFTSSKLRVVIVAIESLVPPESVMRWFASADVGCAVDIKFSPTLNVPATVINCKILSVV